jgi:hypothetical protein
VRQYLKALEEANPAGSDEVAEAETSTPPKKISLTDPAVSWTTAKGGPAFFAYPAEEMAARAALSSG